MIRQALTVPGPISSGGEERGVYAAWAVISSDSINPKWDRSLVSFLKRRERRAPEYQRTTWRTASNTLHFSP
jgi:hypothetical protein